MIKSIHRLLPLLAVFVTATFFSACNKYEEGPSVSLRTPDERVSNVWKIEEFKQDGNVVVLDENANSMRYEFTKDRVYKLYDSRNQADTQIGSWVFKDNNEILGLNNAIDHFVDVRILNIGNYKIIRLAEDELWLERTSDQHGKEEVKLQGE